MRRTGRDVRVVTLHDASLDYHEWVTFGERLRANRLGVVNRRMYDQNWTKWVCNNGACPAWALVSDDLVRSELEEADGLVRTADLPEGLCSSRDDHEPHPVTDGSLAPYLCVADQTQRQPFKGEREQREARDTPR